MICGLTLFGNLEKFQKQNEMIAPNYKANRKLNWTLGKKKNMNNRMAMPVIKTEPLSSDAMKVSRKDKIRIIQSKINNQ